MSMTRRIVNLKTGGVQDVPLTGPEEAAVIVAREAAAAAAPYREIDRIERENPVPYRALRDFVLKVGEALPACKDTVLFRHVLRVEEDVAAARQKISANKS